MLALNKGIRKLSLSCLNKLSVSCYPEYVICQLWTMALGLGKSALNKRVCITSEITVRENCM